jgi:hypothetical protein
MDGRDNSDTPPTIGTAALSAIESVALRAQGRGIYLVHVATARGQAGQQLNDRSLKTFRELACKSETFRR